MKQFQVNKAFRDVFCSPDGKIVLDEIERRTSGSILKKDNEGRTDPYAMAFSAGGKDLLGFIKERIEDGKLAR